MNRVSLIKFLLPANERHEPLVYTMSDWSANKCYFRLFGLPWDSARHFRRLDQCNYFPSNREERRSRKNFSGNDAQLLRFPNSVDASTRVRIIKFGFRGKRESMFRAPLEPDSARINKRKFQLFDRGVREPEISGQVGNTKFLWDRNDYTNLEFIGILERIWIPERVGIWQRIGNKNK